MDRRHIFFRVSVPMTNALRDDVKKEITAALTADPTFKVLVYTSLKSRARTYWTVLFDDLLLDQRSSGVFGASAPIHGDSGLMVKSALVRSFSKTTEKLSMESNCLADNYRLASGTAAVNCGISCPKLVHAIRDGLPPSLFDLSQELGRVGRVLQRSNGYVDCFQVFLSTGSVVDLMLRIHSSEAKTFIKKRQQREMLEVLRSLVLPLGCLHVFLERYFSYEKYVSDGLDDDGSWNVSMNACGNRCSHCTGEHKGR